LKQTFDKLFSATFSKKANQKFVDFVARAFSKQDWKKLLHLFTNAISLVEKKFLSRTDANGSEDHSGGPGESSDSRSLAPALRHQWNQFAAAVSKFSVQREQIKNNFAFAFVEGALVKAVRNGDWVLLDEVTFSLFA
jgi:midasin